MEQRKEIVNRYVSAGLAVTKAVLIAGLSKSSYYHRRTGKPKGKRASTTTRYLDKVIDNAQVIERLEQILGEDDFIDYGYQRACQVLRKEGYVINHKKVYRLMKENRLLFPKRSLQSRRRTFVKYTTPQYIHPFSTVEVDIKYIYIHGVKRHAYLLTLLDTFTRMAVGWTIEYRMTNEIIKPLIERYINNEAVAPYATTSKLKLRSDNGPQFISAKLAKGVENLPLDQEFIRPGTPQQNGHIESFHHTVKKLVTDKHFFNNLDEARSVFERFYKTYNETRIMKSILYCSPKEFLKMWEAGKVGIQGTTRKQKFFFRERQSLS